MTHAELVQRAARWLRGKKHSPVLAEMCGAAAENPDAIGWRYGRSTLVECKTSRSDFRRDADKWFRRSDEHAIGRERWYMAPAGVLRAEEIPEGWGLLAVHGRSITVQRETVRRDLPPTAASYEILMLSAALRRCELGIPFSLATSKFDPYEHPTHQPVPPHWEAL